MNADAPRIECSRFADLSPHRLYALLRLRAEVFVVEQNCAFNDVDGKDTHPETLHYWIDDPDSPGPGVEARVVAAMRVLSHVVGERKISRVVCEPGRRHAGLAGALVRRALDDNAGYALVLDAQSRLEAWYSGFGFEVCGARFLEDGIEHTPMRRAAH